MELKYHKAWASKEMAMNDIHGVECEIDHMTNTFKILLFVFMCALLVLLGVVVH